MVSTSIFLDSYAMRTAYFLALLMVFSLGLTVTSIAQAAPQPVQVYIFAGQSNMVGFGKTEMGRDPAHPYVPGESAVEIVGGLGSLRYMVDNNPATFGHGGTNPLVDANGDWLVRSDVNIYAKNDDLVEKGGHTTGFGKGAWNGPEYGFGQVIGNTTDRDVLIIKIATGGTSLAVNWRSPTAVSNRGGSVGDMWTQLVSDVDSVLTNLATEFPAYAGRDYEIAGFGWHQGWNDGGDQAMVDEYEANMTDFIADVRGEYGVDLRFVIANTGIGGEDLTNARRLGIIAAQNAMDVLDNVAVVETRPMWQGPETSPSDFGFHWNHNGITQYQIGAGMGEAMNALSVPEPSCGLMLGLGVFLVAGRRA